MAVDLSELLQDLAIQTACLGRYSTAQTGIYVTSRYDDPPDWYDPPMMANRFAEMSGSMTRINTFYGVCFDYAQFAWDDIKKYQKMYNESGMKDQQWYIAATNPSDPYTIILYDPVSEKEATTISNGVYLKENSRHKVYSHDGATGHAWIWVQHNNGIWYWIDPTWTDNTGYPWWGIVDNGKEVQYYPDPSFCVSSNYPRPGEENKVTRSSNSTYTVSTSVTSGNYSNNPGTASNSSGSSNDSGDLLVGFNFSPGFPLGFTFGISWFYASLNVGFSAHFDGVTSGSGSREGVTGETRDDGLEFIIGYSFKLIDGIIRLPVGIGMRMTDEYQYYHDSAGNTGWYGDIKLEDKIFIAEAGLQLILFKFFYLSATYRLKDFTFRDFSKNGYTIGAGVIF
jgi:hypothetical protein